MSALAAHLLWACTVFAGAHYGMPPRILWAIHLAEGGYLGSVHRNSNGSRDYGPYQVNSVWLPQLARYGYTSHLLAHQACANSYAAAWVLSQATARAHSLWGGVGRYHSSTPALAHNYVMKVWRIYRSLGP